MPKQSFIFDKTKRHKTFNMHAAHSHPKYHELYFLLSGSTKYFTGNEVYFVNAGEMVFVPKDTFHQTSYSNMADAERVLFNFDDAFLGDGYKEYIEEMTENRHISFAYEDLQTIKMLVEKINKEASKELPGYEEMQGLYFKQLIILVSRLRKLNAAAKTSPTAEFVKKIAKYINTNYSLPLTLASVSKEFSISRPYLSRIFKEITGVGLKEYLTAVRIEEAKNILRRTNLSVTEVASACGFNDSNHFATVFKNIVGITPKKYSLANKAE